MLMIMSAPQLAQSQETTHVPAQTQQSACLDTVKCQASPARAHALETDLHHTELGATVRTIQTA